MSERRLPIVHVAEPCTEDWSAMDVRGEHLRHCGLCDKNVHDLTHLDESERNLWLAENMAARPCVRFVARADGTLSEGDCTPWRVRALQEAKRRSLRAAARLAGALLTLLAAIGLGRVMGFDLLRALASPVQEEIVMGAMALPDAHETHVIDGLR